MVLELKINYGRSSHNFNAITTLSIVSQSIGVCIQLLSNTLLIYALFVCFLAAILNILQFITKLQRYLWKYRYYNIVSIYLFSFQQHTHIKILHLNFHPLFCGGYISASPSTFFLLFLPFLN